MKIAGIVAEYNPFHSGHQWQIEETRRNGATHIVVVMSGCYVQRGEPALWDKWVRAEAALAGGADLVIELPLPYATATAQRFAMGAVSLLHSLGVCELLSFGSECGNVGRLGEAVKALLDDEVEAMIVDILSQGLTYATARERAVEILYGNEVSSLLGQPNNILGIEYMTALRRLDSDIVPMTVKRQGAGHDSEELGSYASASVLRRRIQTGRGIEEAIKYLPEESRRLSVEAWQEGRCVVASLLERPMLAQLRRMTAAELGGLPDISEGLENRIAAAVRHSETLQSLLETAKTKRYSHARLRRILLSAWLGVPAAMSAEPPPYLRLLAMNSRGKEILAEVGNRATLPLSQSLARLAGIGEQQRRFAELEAGADDMYGTITQRIQPCGRDYTNSIIIR